MKKTIFFIFIIRCAFIRAYSNFPLSSVLSGVSDFSVQSFVKTRVSRSTQRFKLLFGNDFFTHGFPKAQETVALHLSGGAEQLGLYYTKIGIGDPVQPQNVLIDTGSTLLWVQCAPCNNCSFSSQNPPFFPDQSQNASDATCSDCDTFNDGNCKGIYANGCQYQCSSGPAAPETKFLSSKQESEFCTFTVAYADRSASAGIVLNDVLTLGNGDQQIIENVFFGCGQAEFGQVVSPPISGLMGLGQSKISVPSQLSSKGKLQNDSFSHCLAGDGTGGQLTFGPSLSTAFQFVPYGTDPITYNITVTGISVGGVGLQLSEEEFSSEENPRGAIVDSGTTTNLFPTKVYGAFRSQLLNDVNGKAGIRQLTQDEINSLVGEDASSYLDTCFLTQAKMPTDLIPTFPNVTIHLNDVQLIWLPSNYLWLFEPIVCFGVYDSETVVGGPITILGEIGLRNREVVYDRQLRRLGFSDFVACL